jgi:hypothetical protein
MFVLRKKRGQGGWKSEYATRSDFCAIFIEHMEPLFLLALLLTGDQRSAEQCFVAASVLCAEGSHVFRDSAASWSRRSVIKNAIRITSPAALMESDPCLLRNGSKVNLDLRGPLQGVQGLPPFDRFVFVMSVLERYSDRECSVLLSCAVTDILPARIRSIQQLSMNDQSNRSTCTMINPYSVDADWLECG